MFCSGLYFVEHLYEHHGLVARQPAVVLHVFQEEGCEFCDSGEFDDHERVQPVPEQLHEHLARLRAHVVHHLGRRRLLKPVYEERLQLLCVEVEVEAPNVLKELLLAQLAHEVHRLVQQRLEIAAQLAHRTHAEQVGGELLAEREEELREATHVAALRQQVQRHLDYLHHQRHVRNQIETLKLLKQLLIDQALHKLGISLSELLKLIQQHL